MGKGTPRTSGQYPRPQTAVKGGVQESTDPSDDMVANWGLNRSTGGEEDAKINLAANFHPSRKRDADG